MPSELKDNLTLKIRLGFLEEWVAYFERNPLNPIELREKTQERGFTDKIASLRGDLIAGWTQLLSHDDVADAAEGRRHAVNVDAAMEQLDLMRRLLTVENWLTRAYGESPPSQISDTAALEVLADSPARALPTLARTRRSPDFDKRIRRALGSGPSRMPFKISRPIMGALLILLLSAAFVYARTLSATPTLTPTSTGTVTSVAPTASTDTNTVGSVATTGLGVDVANEPKAPAPTDTTTASPTRLPSTIPSATPTNTRLPTPKPTPKPSKPPAVPKTQPPPRPTSRVFVAEVQISFHGLSPSDQRRSCVNGRVVNRDGQGVAGAILRVNNGVSQSEAKATNNDGAFEFCGLGASPWSVVLGYVPDPRLVNEVVAVIEVSGQEGQFARVLFRERR